MNRLGAALILILILAGFSFVPSAFAQGYNPIPSAEEMGRVVDEKSRAGQTSKEVYNVNTVTLLMNTGTCFFAGCSRNPESVFYYGKSAVAGLSSVVTAMYVNPPADLAYWIQDTGVSLGFIPKQAMAQGIGFSGFSALLPLWKVFRNVAYFLLAAVMIGIGFMVMFRRKIDPKTVVTVQNALPRIVLALLLITFSYAIVGVMVDIMYLLSYLAVGIFKSSGLLPAPDTFLPWTTPNTPEAIYVNGSLLQNMVEATEDWSIYRLFGINASALSGSLVSVSIGAILALTGLIPGLGANFALLGLIGLVLPVLQLLLAIAVIFLFIRLLIFFLSAYIQIIIALLFGPIQLMVGAVPGTNTTQSWLQNLLANMAVFPIGAVFFMLSAIFGNFATQGNTAVWAPGLAPLVQSTTAISMLVSIGILFALPSVAGQIKEALKVKSFAGPEGVAGVFSQPIGLAMQGYQMIASHQMMNAMKKNVPGQAQEAQPRGG